MSEELELVDPKLEAEFIPLIDRLTMKSIEADGLNANIDLLKAQDRVKEEQQRFNIFINGLFKRLGIDPQKYGIDLKRGVLIKNS